MKMSVRHSVLYFLSNFETASVKKLNAELYQSQMYVYRYVENSIDY